MVRILPRAHKVPLNAQTARFVETLGSMWEGYGLPRGAGRIFGLLLLAARALSAEEISAALHVSRSSVSTDVRELLSIGLVERIRVPGDRTGYYMFSPHAWEHVAAIRSQEARRSGDLAEHTLGALPAGHPGRKGLEEFKEWAEIFGDAVDQVRAELSARARRRTKGTRR
jgi:DNA-binding transcriptional regulator GbsR (MarR family)